MEAVMGGKKKVEDKKDVTFDPYSRQMLDSATRNVNELTGQEFAPYTGERVVDITQGERDAVANYLGNNVSNRGFVEQGLSMAQQGAQYTPDQIQSQNFTDADISGYMNPYMENVINNALSDIDRREMASAENIDAQASRASAFGGSRQAIQQAENTRNFGEIAAKTAAQLRQQGYEDAANRVQADAQRQLMADQYNQSAGLRGADTRARSAGQVAQMAGQLSDADMRAMQIESGLGAADREIEQQRLQAAYDDYLAGINDRYRRADYQIQLGQLTPNLQDSTSTRTTSGGSGIGGMIGQGLLGLASMPSGGVGAGILGGLFSKPSAPSVPRVDTGFGNYNRL